MPWGDRQGAMKKVTAYRYNHRNLRLKDPSMAAIIDLRPDSEIWPRVDTTTMFA
jgi:hypothetical protein